MLKREPEFGILVSGSGHISNKLMKTLGLNEMPSLTHVFSIT